MSECRTTIPIMDHSATCRMSLHQCGKEEALQFADEVFRVFQNEHPKVKISYLNANADVEFMVKRGASNSG